MGRSVIPLFEDDEEWSRLLKIAEEWIGTPYRHLTMVKGRGADCTLFLGAILMEAGLLQSVEYDYYACDWHIHTKQELVMESLVDHLQKRMRPGLDSMVIKKPTPEIALRGDLLGFSTVSSGVTNHAALCLGDGMMIHSVNGKGVAPIRFGKFWREKLTTIFRVLI